VTARASYELSLLLELVAQAPDPRHEALLEEVERRLLGLKGSGWKRFRQLAAAVPATDRSLRELLDAQYLRGE
jgi:hypothetical protein